MTELKSCPFCGGEAEFKTELSRSGLYDTTLKTYIYVKCKSCHAESDAFKESPYYSAQQEAIKAWNRRVGENNALEKLEDEQ